MAIKTVTLAINGQTYTLIKNTITGLYEKSITAPAKSSYGQSGHVYGMILRAEDTAGNVTTIDRSNAVFGEKMKLDVNEKVPPVIAITMPGAGAYLTSNTVNISFDITDNDSGVSPSSITLQADNLAVVTSGITKAAISGGYRCTYTMTLADGQHTIKAGASDYDGNIAIQKSVTFKVDTVPPALNVTSPAAGVITNSQNCQVAGSTNDVTSPACTVIMKLNNTDQGAVTVNGDGSFAKSVSLVKGTNTIYVKSTDRAGKYSEVTRTAIYDPDAPTIHSVTLTPNPVDAGSTFTIAVHATD